MSDILKEENISMGFRAPIYSVTTCIPQCNICVYWDGPGKCKKLGDSPDDFGWGKRHDCPYAVLNTEHFSYPKYEELYPDACKASKKGKAEK